MIGQTISHYKILEKLGEGGMGVVYKAEDTTLDRFVALKFLPPSLQAGEQEKARFIQEAKAAAALNHPNICSVIAIDESDGQLFIVMEFVDGQTLRDKRGQISFKQAIDIGIQIADGLAAAHEKGIVHRDIKPENIMIRKDGICQIMDFGLAKLRSASSKINRLTKEGSTVGTAGYMSPEQIQGQDVDHRSDIFSFGVLLYELLTGQLPFKGVHETALAYEIVNVDAAPLSSVKPEIDPSLDAIVLDCLEKDPRERTQSVAQVSVDLKRYRRESSRSRASRITAVRPVTTTGRTDAPPEQPARSSGKPVLSYILFGVMALAIVMLLWSPWTKEHTISQPVGRFFIELPDEAPLFGTSGGLTVSPDGRTIVYLARIANTTQLYVHRLDQLGSQPIPGTENALEPSFSPDGEWVVFAANGKLVKVPLSGGAPEEVCVIPNLTRGVYWAFDNTIFFGLINNAIFRVNAGGGTAVAVTALDTAAGEISHRVPFLLPDGRTLMYTVKNNNITTFNDAVIVAQRLDNGERKVLVRGGSDAKYIPTGHLMYVRGSTILAMPFDVDRLEVRGSAVPLEEGGWMNEGSGQANVDFSANGIFVVAPSGALSGQANSLSWMDRTGLIHPLFDTLRSYQGATLSPDGQKIAIAINAANNDIWVLDIPRGILSRLTFGGGNHGNQIWSPDGKYVLYSSEDGRQINIFRKPWDGSSKEERLTNSPEMKAPRSVTPDGKTVSFDSRGDIGLLSLGQDGTPAGNQLRPFIQSPASETFGLISPDGRWIAYTSDESGKRETYVTSFPGHQGKWQISNGGGLGLFWSRDGKELFFRNGTTLMAAGITAGSTFDYAVPKKICDIPLQANIQDISPDGKQFLAIVAPRQDVVLPRLEVVTNWFDAVRSRFGGNR